MKKHTLVIIAVIFLTYVIQIPSISQEREVIDTVQLECIYNYVFQQDSLTQSSLTSLPMILQIGSKYSRFTGENTPAKDSIFDANKNASTQHTINQIMPLITSQPGNILAKYSIYKNYPAKGTVEMTSFLSREAMYRVVQTVKTEWSINSSADTTILGYRCKKATTRFAGRDYTAWFTLDIPVSEGPYKFYGLPGLIVYIEDTQKQHRFELTGIQKPEHTKPVYYDIQPYITITPQNYIKAIEQDRNRRLQRFSNMQELTEENRARALRNTLMKNNFIERY